jgi:hypothetical protein
MQLWGKNGSAQQNRSADGLPDSISGIGKECGPKEDFPLMRHAFPLGIAGIPRSAKSDCKMAHQIGTLTGQSKIAVS